MRTVIELAHTLGLSVTAEGVETIEQETVLQGWGCDVIQGFLRFRPAPAARGHRVARKGQAGRAAAGLSARPQGAR